MNETNQNIISILVNILIYYVDCFGTGTLNLLQSNLSGIHGSVLRVQKPYIFLSA